MILEKVAPKSMETLSYRPIDIYISTSENICLVAIDFAGLSTNTSDLYDFIQVHGSIKTIIIDLSASTGFMKHYNRDDIIDNPSILKDFDCRKPCYKRS
ncbi:hypothetical protein MFLAVUS_011199 [Mucor flavus]|uniref:Uncharacterized protein n=1 Tax=Mucor flavus TaxID=439312 RepID=A0ABP9ZEV6_9FUNG